MWSWNLQKRSLRTSRVQPLGRLCYLITWLILCSTNKVLEERNQWTKVHELVHISWAGTGTQSHFWWTSNKNTSYRFHDLIEERNQISFCERERELNHFFRELPIPWIQLPTPKQQLSFRPHDVFGPHNLRESHGRPFVCQVASAQHWCQPASVWGQRLVWTPPRVHGHCETQLCPEWRDIVIQRRRPLSHFRGHSSTRFWITAERRRRTPRLTINSVTNT